MRPFDEIVEKLNADGALRDFYIPAIDMGLWQLFLDSIRHLIKSQDFRIDGVAAPLPAMASAIFAIRNSASPCLSIHVGTATVCCHFFTEDELELDFVPTDYATEERWNELCEFFTKICVTLSRGGFVCYENTQNLVIETFHSEVHSGS